MYLYWKLRYIVNISLLKLLYSFGISLGAFLCVLVLVLASLYAIFNTQNEPMEKKSFSWAWPDIRIRNLPGYGCQTFPEL